MNISGSENLVNGLTGSVDWISFTFKDMTEPFDAVRLMGYSREEFIELPSGRNGYSKAIKSATSNLHIGYAGNDGMGVHVDVSGSSILELLTHFHDSRSIKTPFGSIGYIADTEHATVLSDFLRTVFDHGGSFTRLDLAVDDIGCAYFTVAELVDIFRAGLYSSRSRKGDIHEGFGENTGSTVYLGSRSSNGFLRIYDKQAEQNDKLKKARKPLIETLWTRWEIELKKEYANKAAQLLSDDMAIGDVVLGILGSYVRLIVPDHTRKSNCSTLPKWNEFLAGVAGVKLYQRGEPKTIEDTHAWLNAQCATAFATVFTACGGDMGIIYELLDNGRGRLKKRHRAQIEAYQRKYGMM